MSRILETIGRECRSRGVELAPHLPLKHLANESSDVCLRALRDVARAPTFDDVEAAELLRMNGDWREQFVVAMALLFRPATDALKSALLDRLRVPSICSPQFTCIASATGALTIADVTRQLEERLARDVDPNDRGLVSRALGALDACVKSEQLREASTASIDRSAYEAGARTLLEWRARLEAALDRIS